MADMGPGMMMPMEDDVDESLNQFHEQLKNIDNNPNNFQNKNPMMMDNNLNDYNDEMDDDPE